MPTSVVRFAPIRRQHEKSGQERAAMCLFQKTEGNGAEIRRVVCATDCKDPIYPGPLCREFLTSSCGPEVEIVATGSDGNWVVQPLRELFRMPSPYRGLAQQEAKAKASALGGQVKPPEDALAAKVYQAAFALARKQEPQSLGIRPTVVYPITFAAAVGFEDGEVAFAAELKGIEYGCTVDAASLLIPELQRRRGHSDTSRARVLMQVDNFGVAHAPFSGARSLLVEHGFGDVLVTAHGDDGQWLEPIKVKEWLPCRCKAASWWQCLRPRWIKRPPPWPWPRGGPRGAGPCPGVGRRGPDPAPLVPVDEAMSRRRLRQCGGIQRLRFFKERLGFEARHVLDIGAHVGNWTTDALEVFPSARFLMIEANPLHRPQLEAIGQPFVIALLAAKGAEAVVVSEVFRGERCCDLLKADVQGAELTVLLGGLKTLSQAQLVLLEAPVLPYNEGAPSFSEVIAFMAAHHFELVDVADATYSEAPGGDWRKLWPAALAAGGWIRGAQLAVAFAPLGRQQGPPIDARPRLRSRGLTAKLAAFAMPTPPSPPTDATGGGATDTADVTTSDSFLGFVCGDTVVAARDLRVRGKVVVRQGGSGYVIGPAASSGRICVQNRLNCLPDELRHTLAGGYLAGTRVRSHRTLESPAGTSIPAGCSGVVIGPARDPLFQRLLVRFALNGQDHVEELVCDPQDVESSIPGNFRRGNAVIATRDLRVNGQVVVREGVLGTVVGPSHSDSQHRVTVSFSHREETWQHMPCTGGLVPGDRVAALRQLLVVPKGAQGMVVGPSCSQSSRVAVRFHSSSAESSGECADSSEEVVLHVEPEDLKVLHAVAEDVDDALQPLGGRCRSDLMLHHFSLGGGYNRGDAVAATRDLRVGGKVVVRANILGTVVGPSGQESG
eukprot:g31281.t1